LPLLDLNVEGLEELELWLGDGEELLLLEGLDRVLELEPLEELRLPPLELELRLPLELELRDDDDE
jgi:hypothetical protein